MPAVARPRPASRRTGRLPTPSGSCARGSRSAGASTPSRPEPRSAPGGRRRVLPAGAVLRLGQAAPHARLRLLPLDEPFGSVDPPAHLRLMQSLLAWLRDSSRRAAVLVSHSPLVDLGLAEASGVPTTEWTIDGGRAWRGGGPTQS